MAKVMTLKLDGTTHELGPCETQGAVHVVRLTEAGRTLYLANRPDTELVTLHGRDLHVRASFIRHMPSWRVVGEGPGSIPGKPAPSTHPPAAAKPAAEDDTADVEGYAGMGKPQLLELCESRGLTTTSRMTKADLVELLHDDDLNG